MSKPLSQFLFEHNIDAGLIQVITSLTLSSKTMTSYLRHKDSFSLHRHTLNAKTKQNRFGENVHELDVFANKTFVNPLKKRCSLIASEELHEPIQGRASARYIVALDPLDGSSNIDVNVTIGTIFGIYFDDRNDDDMPRTQVGAGYFLYGPTTLFVLALDQTNVCMFVLDSMNNYVLLEDGINTPDAATLSVNEGNHHRWLNGSVRRYVNDSKASGNSCRYVGSMVADCHRTLIKGGIFLYPGDIKNPLGKLRVFYEAKPIAYLFDKAGGRAITTECKNILDIVPKTYHERTSVVVGSRSEVNRFMLDSYETHVPDNRTA